MRGRTKSFCKYCNKEFSHVLSKKPKYCSFECKINSQKRSVTCICKVCGKKYIVFKKYNEGKGSTFCSQKCRSNQKITKSCKNCKKDFMVKPSQSSQEFCNKGCKKEFSIVKRKRKCSFCNMIFFVDFPSTKIKYCSDNCKLLDKKKTSFCKTCKKEFLHRPSVDRKYCSIKCSNNDQTKVDNLIKKTVERIRRGDCVSKTELLLKKDLVKNGFTPQFITKFGSIDYAHADKKIAVFVDGIFWHGHDKCHWKNTSFRKTIEKTKRKDEWQNKYMVLDGWVVLRYWDDYVRKHTDECIDDILNYFN